MPFNFDGFRLPTRTGQRASQTEITSPPVDTADRALLSRKDSSLVGAQRYRGPGDQPVVPKPGSYQDTSAKTENWWDDFQEDISTSEGRSEVLDNVFNVPTVGSPFQFAISQPPAIIPPEDEGEGDTGEGDTPGFWSRLGSTAGDILGAALQPGGPGSDPIQKEIGRQLRGFYDHVLDMLGLASEDISPWEDNPLTSQQVEQMKEFWSNEQIGDFYRKSIWHQPDSSWEYPQWDESWSPPEWLEEAAEAAHLWTGGLPSELPEDLPPELHEDWAALVRALADRIAQLSVDYGYRPGWGLDDILGLPPSEPPISPDWEEQN